MIVILQARMSSQRLPGKVLQTIQNKPLLKFLIESLKQAKNINKIVVATSIEQTDDLIAEFCVQNQIECFRGDLTNVASRYQAIIEQYHPQGFVRVCGDSPLLDYRLIEQAVDLFLNQRCDVVTNVRPRTFPVGQCVEVVKSTTFTKTYPLLTETFDQEHVIPYFYRHPDTFSIYNFSATKPCAEVRLSLDTAEDLNNLQNLIAKMDKPHWQYTWSEMVKLCCE